MGDQWPEFELWKKIEQKWRTPKAIYWISFCQTQTHSKKTYSLSLSLPPPLSSASSSSSSRFQLNPLNSPFVHSGAPSSVSSDISPTLRTFCSWSVKSVFSLFPLFYFLSGLTRGSKGDSSWPASSLENRILSKKLCFVMSRTAREHERPVTVWPNRFSGSWVSSPSSSDFDVDETLAPRKSMLKPSVSSLSKGINFVYKSIESCWLSLTECILIECAILILLAQIPQRLIGQQLINKNAKWPPIHRIIIVLIAVHFGRDVTRCSTERFCRHVLVQLLR